MFYKAMTTDLKYCLVFTTSINEKPTVHGYDNQEERDEVYAMFQVTGRLSIKDDNLGTEKVTFEPVYVARFDMIDGSINKYNIQNELNKLAE